MSNYNDYPDGYPSSIDVQLSQDPPLETVAYDLAGVIIEFNQSSSENSDYTAVSVELNQQRTLKYHERMLRDVVPNPANIAGHVIDMHSDDYRGLGGLLDDAAELFSGFLSQEDQAVLDEATALAKTLGVTAPEVELVLGKASDGYAKKLIAFAVDKLVWKEAVAQAKTLGIDSLEVELVLGKASSEYAKRAIKSFLPEAIVRPQAIEEIKQIVAKESSSYTSPSKESTIAIVRALNTVLWLRAVPDWDGKQRTDKEVFVFARHLLEESQDTVAEEGLKVTCDILWKCMGSKLKGSFPFKTYVSKAA